jgi:hypothetical protein
MQKERANFFNVINKVFYFDKHLFFENKSLVSASSAIPSLYFYKSKLKLVAKKITQLFCFELGRHSYLIYQLHGSAEYPPLSRASVEVRTDLTAKPRKILFSPSG